MFSLETDWLLNGGHFFVVCYQTISALLPRKSRRIYWPWKTRRLMKLLAKLFHLKPASKQKSKSGQAGFYSKRWRRRPIFLSRVLGLYRWEFPTLTRLLRSGVPAVKDYDNLMKHILKSKVQNLPIFTIFVWRGFLQRFVRFFTSFSNWSKFKLYPKELLMINFDILIQ